MILLFFMLLQLQSLYKHSSIIAVVCCYNFIVITVDTVDNFHHYIFIVITGFLVDFTVAVIFFSEYPLN